jgi:hypothetical protein
MSETKSRGKIDKFVVEIAKSFSYIFDLNKKKQNCEIRKNIGFNE